MRKALKRARRTLRTYRDSFGNIVRGSRESLERLAYKCMLPGARVGKAEDAATVGDAEQKRSEEKHCSGSCGF